MSKIQPIPEIVLGRTIPDSEGDDIGKESKFLSAKFDFAPNP